MCHLCVYGRLLKGPKRFPELDVEQILDLPEGFAGAVLTLQKFYNGGAASDELAAELIERFNEMDIDVFSKQEWMRLHETHHGDVVVTYADGTTTHGIDAHIKRLQVTSHPIAIGTNGWTAAMGITEGTFTSPLPIGEDNVLEPTP